MTESVTDPATNSKAEPSDTFESPSISVWQGARLPLAIITALSLPILFYGLGSYSLVNGDEGIYHAISRSMLESGNWFYLQFTGEHRAYDTFMNAPLQYWLRGNLIRLFGDNYWTMRVTSAVTAWMSLIAIFALVRKFSTRRAAILSSLMLLTNFQFVYMHCARTGDLEAPLCLMMILSVFTFTAGLLEKRSFLPHFLCLIVIVNLKAPVVLLPLLADLACFAIVPDFRLQFWRWFKTALILPLGFCWHIGQLFHTGLSGFESLQTMIQLAPSSSADLPITSRSWLNAIGYMDATLFGAFPFVLAYPFAIASSLRSAPSRQAALHLRVLVLYVAIIYAFFVPLGTWHSWYILPAAPLLCGLVGIWLDGVGREGKGAYWAVVPGLLAGCALAVRILDINPFSFRGVHLPLELMEWRQYGSLGTAVGTLLISAIFIAGLAFTQRAWPKRHRAFAFALIAVCFFGVSAGRILEPLRFIDTFSEMERIRDEIDHKAAAGEALSFPINVSEAGAYRVRYFFGDEFEIISFPRTPNMTVYFQLVGYGKTAERPPERGRR